MEKINNIDSFLKKVDTATNKIYGYGKSGRKKANFQMHCRWKTPCGSHFTYRSDDTLRQLIEKKLMKKESRCELKAIQVQFAIKRSRAQQAIIYDNNMPVNEDNIIFFFKNEKILVNKIEWEL